MEEEFIPPEEQQGMQESKEESVESKREIPDEIKPYLVKSLKIKNIEIIRETAYLTIDADGEEYSIGVPVRIIIDQEKFNDFIKFLKEMEIPYKRYEREKIRELENKIKDLIGKTF